MGYDSDEENEPIPYLTKEEMKHASDFNNVLVTSEPHHGNVIFQKKKIKNNSKTTSQPDFIGDITNKEVSEKSIAQPASVPKKEELVMGQGVVTYETGKKSDEVKKSAKTEKEENIKSFEKSRSDIDRLLKELESKK
jgi:hypothetical protein